MGIRLIKLNNSSNPNKKLVCNIKQSGDNRSVIFGTVMDYQYNVLQDALVKLFEVTDECNKKNLKSISYTFTDKDGHFTFGPLSPYKEYVIKVWYYD